VIGYEKNKNCFAIYNKYIKIGACPSISEWKKFHHVQKDVHVNSGCIIGYAGEIYKMFHWILNYKEFTIYDDQIGVGFYMNKFPQKVQLDLEENFVVNDMFGSDHHIEEVGGIIMIDGKRKNSYFLHFPALRYIFNPIHQSKNNYYLTSYYVVNDDTYTKEITLMDILQKSQILIGILILILFSFFFISRLVSKNDFIKQNKPKKPRTN
jgi:hypothetical protein